MIDLSDPISRQQAITALRALSDKDGYINVPHEVVTDVVRGLPPVQLKHEQTTHSEQTKTDELGVKTSETCDDCILRQAAIDAMANTLWHYPNECYRNLSEYEFAKGLAELGLKSVPPAPSRTGEWIPVTERLPESKEEDLEYPTVIIDLDGQVALGCYYESTREWRMGEYFNQKCFPIAWMPLPDKEEWDGER